jgi:hypothetical protein
MLLLLLLRLLRSSSHRRFDQVIADIELETIGMWKIILINCVMAIERQPRVLRCRG